MNQLSLTSNQSKSGTLQSNMLQTPRNDGTCMEITTMTGRVLSGLHSIVQHKVNDVELDYVVNYGIPIESKKRGDLKEKSIEVEQ